MEYTHFRLLMPLIRTTNSNDLKNIGKYTREMLQKKNMVYRKTKQKFVVYMKKRVNDAKIPDMSMATLTDNRKDIVQAPSILSIFLQICSNSCIL